MFPFCLLFVTILLSVCLRIYIVVELIS